MARCSSTVSIVNAAISVFIGVVILHQSNNVSASPAPLFFDAIANFFKPSQPASGYGAPKPNNIFGGIGQGNLGLGNLGNLGGLGQLGGNGGPQLPQLGGFKLPGFNLFGGGGGKRPSGGASYGPPTNRPNRPAGGGSPGKPPFSFVPNIFNTSPTRVPNRPRPGYGPPQRPNRPRPTQRPNRPRPTQRPNRPRPTQRPSQPHCNACSGPWNTVPGYNQQNNNAQPTYFPQFPSNGQASTNGGAYGNNNNNNNFRQPQYGQSSSTFNTGQPLPTYASSINNNGGNQFPKNMGVIDSTASIDSYGAPQGPVIDNDIDGYGAPQAPVINNDSQDEYGSSNTQDTTSDDQYTSNGNQENDVEAISGEFYILTSSSNLKNPYIID